MIFMRGEYNIGRGSRKCRPLRRGIARTQGGFLAMESRRKFLTTIIAVGVPAGILARAPSGQLRAQRPQNPEQQKDKDDDSHMPKLDPMLILAANQKEIKKNVEKLSDIFLNFLLIRRQDQLGIELGHMRIIILFLLLFGILRALGA